MTASPAKKPAAAIFDWDGTMHSGFVVQSWCDYLSERAIVPETQVAVLKDLFAQYRASLLSHEELSARAATIYAAITFHLSPDVLKAAAQEFLRTPQASLYEFAAPLLALLKRLKIRTIVVSGAPLEIISAYVSTLEIEEVHAMEVDRASAQPVVVNVGLSHEKESVVRDLLARYRISFGLGNSISDIAILAAARVPILVNGDANAFPDALRRRLIPCTEYSVLDTVRSHLED